MSSTLSPSARIAILLRRRIGALREDRHFDAIVRQKHVHIVAFSMVGLLTMSITQGVLWTVSGDRLRDAYFDDPDVQPTLVNILYLSQAVISWSTIVVCALIAQKYRLLLMAKRAEWTGTSLIEAETFRGDNALNTQDRTRFVSSYSFWRSSLKWWFLLEILVQVPHPILWMNSNYSDTIPKNIGFKLLQCFMFFRLSLIPNIFHLMSDSYIKRFEIVNRSPELQRSGYKFGPRLTLKLFFFNHTSSSLVFLMMLSVILYGYCQWNVSREEKTYAPDEDRRFSSIWNCIYFSYVAFSTVGYGDYIPTLFYGRLVSVLTTLTGSFVFVIFASVLVSRVSLTKEQRLSVEYLATRRGDERYQTAAVNLIVEFSRFSLLKVKRDLANEEVKRAESKRRADIASQSVGTVNGESNGEGAADAVVPVKVTTLFSLYSTGGHKSNKLYYAIRRFRAARQQLNAALMQPEDAVVHEKLIALDGVAEQLQVEVEEYVDDVKNFEEALCHRVKLIEERVTRLTGLGNVAV